MTKNSEIEKRAELAAVWPPNEEVARLAGHKKMSPLKAIRHKCIDCCGYQLSEVRLCVAIDCSLWPFRSGKHPYTTKRTLESKTSTSESDSKVKAHGEGVDPQFDR